MVGEKITSIRQSQNMSTEELAERSGLSIQQVNSIEKDAILPSLSPLIKIARVLGVRLGTFMDDNDEIGPVVTLKDQAGEAMSFSNNNDVARLQMSYSSLAGRKSGRHMEPFIIEVKPEGESYKSSQHEGEEFIYVLEGKVEINYGNEQFELKQGDSIYYDSIVAHHVHAKDGKAKILATVYVPA